MQASDSLNILALLSQARVNVLHAAVVIVQRRQKHDIRSVVPMASSNHLPNCIVYT